LVRGATDAGWLAFTLLGIFCLASPTARAQTLAGIGGWTRQDTFVSLAVSSVFIFKLTSTLWAATPRLAVANAIWHIYLITWPLVFLAISYCKPKLNQALAWGLILIGMWDVYALLNEGIPLYHQGAAFTMNTGILAELVLIAGSWLLIAATSSNQKINKQSRLLFIAATLCAWVVLYTTDRRTEWIGFFIITVLIGVWRIRHLLNLTRSLALLLGLMMIGVAFFYLRQERLLLAYNEALQYFSQVDKTTSIAITTAVGARLEMYRLGISAFLDHPILGMSAGVRPDLLPQYGGGGLGGDQFHHRHFHSEFVQALAEGGMVWATTFLIAIIYFIRKLILEPFKTQGLASILAFGLVASFILAGSFSASLIYNQPIATFVVFSAFLWAIIRSNRTGS
jgi:hypothetical protein